MNIKGTGSPNLFTVCLIDLYFVKVVTQFSGRFSRLVRLTRRVPSRGIDSRGESFYASFSFPVFASSLDHCLHIFYHLFLNRSRSFSLFMRAVTVKEVMWCWSCNKVMEHDVSNHPGSAGGWVTIVCKGCRSTQVEQLWKDGQMRDSLRGQI
jgi:hypothetical protein